MTLTAGTRLGAYEITGSLGVGGMGEVYRAKDTKLGRDVAIKTLPSALARQPDELVARRIPGTEESLTNPFFSADGQSVGYYAGEELKQRVPTK